MLYVCVRGVMVVGFSAVCIEMRGAVGARIWEI